MPTVKPGAMLPFDASGKPIRVYQPERANVLSARFHEILAECGVMHDVKQADYGTDEDPFANVRATEEFGIDAWIGAVIRLADKVQRLKSMVRNGSLKNESVEDSLTDIAVYAIIGRVLWEELQSAGDA
jgi:hypothetical protein